MIPFTKMHGLGNDFILVDAIRTPIKPSESEALSRQMNHRKFGIGGDGLILAERGEAAPFKMLMYNPDGSESEMCGNGIRCFAKFVRAKGYTSELTIPVETGAGLLELQLQENGQVRVAMGAARFRRGEIPVAGNPDEEFIEQPVEVDELRFVGTAVSMGNPHVVIFTEKVSSVPLERWGPLLEHHPLFPNRINVHFAEIVSRQEIIQRTWERGAGVTLACGTGACAVAAAAFKSDRAERDVTIQLPGGSLRIECTADGTVFMTGPAETVFEGEWGAA
ncbi:MAG: diaminopimelate epimerase [Fimbriimonadaceae bacterium]